jgi:hypothetical protein
MKAILQAIGFGAIATTIIGGIVIAVSLIDHRVDKSSEPPNDISTEIPERPSNRPSVSEKVQYDGWEEIDEETFETKAEYRHEFKACYCTVYDDDYMELLIPCSPDNDEFDTIVIEPWDIKEQNHIPYEFLMVNGYYLDYSSKRAWSIINYPGEYLGGYASYREGTTP